MQIALFIALFWRLQLLICQMLAICHGSLMPCTFLSGQLLCLPWVPCEPLRVSHLSYPIVCCESIRKHVHFQTPSFHFMGLKSCLSHHCLLPHCAWVFSSSLTKHQRNSWYGMKPGAGKLPRGQTTSQEAVQPGTFPVISRPSPRPGPHILS